MRISELAEHSGVPLATVKYYLREGLLPPGRWVNARLAEYDAGHVARLRLLRTLREVGAVPVSRLRDLVGVTEDAGLSVHDVLAAAAAAIAPPAPPPGPLRDRARAAAAEVVDGAGWDGVGATSPDRENLAAALEVVMSSGALSGGPSALRPYVEAADTLGRLDVTSLDAEDPAALMEQMVVGQIVFGQILLVLRRLAEEHHSSVRFRDPPPPQPPR